jgi:hypothetical protein
MFAFCFFHFAFISFSLALTNLLKFVRIPSQTNCSISEVAHTTQGFSLYRKMLTGHRENWIRSHDPFVHFMTTACTVSNSSINVSC